MVSVVIDIPGPSKHKIKKNEFEKLKKYQDLKEEQEQMWKAKEVSVMEGALEAVLTLSWKSGSDRSQERHLNFLSRRVQCSAGTATILCTNSEFSSLTLFIYLCMRVCILAFL